MRVLTLNQKRLLAGIYLVVLLAAAGNHYLEWGLVGAADRKFMAVVMLVGLVAMARYGPQLMDELHAHQAAIRESEDAAERARDKSNDDAEAERLRRAIGMPPNTSLERTRD